jgi:hypothetical protein
LTIGGFATVYEALTGGFSWKQYSFESGKLLVKLPFELKKSTPSSLVGEIAYGQSYQAGNDLLNITLSYTELKAEYKFDLEQMFRYSLETLKGAEDIKVVGQKYEELTRKNYPGGKMTVEFITGGTKYMNEYVYIIVGNNKCWYLCNTYQTGDNKSKEASNKIFNSIKLK